MRWKQRVVCGFDELDLGNKVPLGRPGFFFM